MVAEKKDFVFEVFNILFQVLTWWYIAEILIVICVVFGFFSFLFLIAHYKIFKFLMIDRIRFIKNYMYAFIYQKTNFVKSFIYAFWREVNKPRLIFIILSIILLIIICIWLFMKVK